MRIGPWGAFGIGTGLGFLGGDIYGSMQERRREQQMMIAQQNALLYQETYGQMPGQYPPPYQQFRPPFNPALGYQDPRLAYWGTRPGQMPYPPQYGYNPNYSRYPGQDNRYRDVLPPTALDCDMRTETQDCADKLLGPNPDICGVMNHLRILGMLDKQNKLEHPNDPSKQTHLWYSEYLAIQDLVRRESQGQLDFQTPFEAQTVNGQRHRIFTLLGNGQVIADSDHPTRVMAQNRPGAAGPGPDYEPDGSYDYSGGNGTLPPRRDNPTG
jgi:hypothetical protein